jgi:hypothetical protein
MSLALSAMALIQAARTSAITQNTRFASPGALAMMYESRTTLIPKQGADTVCRFPIGVGT